MRLEYSNTACAASPIIWNPAETTKPIRCIEILLRKAHVSKTYYIRHLRQPPAGLKLPHPPLMVGQINQRRQLMTTRSKGTALITGASTGIGAVYADRLAHRGYDLILVARNRGKLDTLATRLTNETRRSVEVLPAEIGRAHV